MIRGVPMIDAKTAWEIRHDRQKSEVEYWLNVIGKKIEQDAYDIDLDIAVAFIETRWENVDYYKVIQEIVKQLKDYGYKIKILESENNQVPICISWGKESKEDN